METIYELSISISEEFLDYCGFMKEHAEEILRSYRTVEKKSNNMWQSAFTCSEKYLQTKLFDIQIDKEFDQATVMLVAKVSTKNTSNGINPLSISLDRQKIAKLIEEDIINHIKDTTISNKELPKTIFERNIIVKI